MQHFFGESPYRRQAYRPRGMGQTGLPPGPIPTTPQPAPMPVSAPVGTAAPTVPAPPPPVVPSVWPDKLLLGAGLLIGGGVAWLGFRTGSREKSTGIKIASYGLGALGAIKALWDAGTLLGWPANRFPA